MATPAPRAHWLVLAGPVCGFIAGIVIIFAFVFFMSIADSSTGALVPLAAFAFLFVSLCALAACAAWRERVLAADLGPMVPTRSHAR